MLGCAEGRLLSFYQHHKPHIALNCTGVGFISFNTDSQQQCHDINGNTDE